MTYLLGIDVGTSGLKSLLVDVQGRTIGEAYRVYVPAIPRPGWAEQAPDDWVEAALSATHEAVERAGIRPVEVAGIGFSGQMHSTIVLDATGNPLRPALLWLDTRAARQVESLWQTFGADQLAAWIGNPVMAGVTLASLLWLKKEEPTTWSRVRHVMMAKDYVRLRLTGQVYTDMTDASASALFDVGRGRWCSELLAETGIPSTLLPQAVAPTQVVGRLDAAWADRMGLAAGTPVVCGAGDQEAQAVGNGILYPGLLSCTIGTGGQIFAPAAEYRPDPALRLHTFCHAVPGLWHWMAATLTAGLSLRWLRDEVLGGMYSYDDLAAAASSVEAGAEGLLFLPYLAGERTPHLDPSARGVFYGLTLRHTWRHMARAVMEGVVFSLLDGLRLVQALGGSVEQVVASGGGVRHPLWLQLQADIFDAEILRTASQEAAALGAALLAGVGAGVYTTLDAAVGLAVHPVEPAVHPRPEFVTRYGEISEWYRSMYPVLAQKFREHFA